MKGENLMRKNETETFWGRPFLCIWVSLAMEIQLLIQGIHFMRSWWSIVIFPVSKLNFDTLVIFIWITFLRVFGFVIHLSCYFLCYFLYDFGFYFYLFLLLQWCFGLFLRTTWLNGPWVSISFSGPCFRVSSLSFFSKLTFYLRHFKFSFALHFKGREDKNHDGLPEAVAELRGLILLPADLNTPARAFKPYKSSPKGL